MPERDAFEEWWAEEVRAAGNLSLTTQQIYLLEQCFRAGARSRDAEVETRRFEFQLAQNELEADAQGARDVLQRFREIDYCPGCAAKLHEAGLRVDVNEPEEDGDHYGR